jgi:protein-arginine kinase activator protein McsA
MFENDDFLRRFLSNLDLLNLKGQWKEEKKIDSSGNTIRVFIFEPETNQKQDISETIKNLEKELNHAVEVEDYLKAADLKKQIDSFKNKADKISELRKQIELAVKEEDYLKAADLKKQIDSL